jgi:hypothetical protein
MAITKRTRKQADRLSTSAAAALLGITPAQFRRLAERIRLEPTGSYKNPHYCSGPECPHWPVRRVRNLVGSEAVAAVRERSAKAKAAREPKQARQRNQLALRYPDWRAALQPAVEALFSLNRYAKWPKCSGTHREEIYRLKCGDASRCRRTPDACSRPPELPLGRRPGGRCR